MLNLVRASAILEGISYLALFAVSMPLKYLADLPRPNIYIGYAHGFLFIAYALLAMVYCIQKKWGFKRMLVMFTASLLPFGTFYIDQKYLAAVSAKS